MKAPDDRLLDIGLQELVGPSRAPDVRGLVRQQVRETAARRRPRRRLTLVAVAGLLSAAAITVTVLLWPDRDDRQVESWLTTLTARSDALGPPADAAWYRSYVEVVATTQARPELWDRLRPALQARLETGIDPMARSRLLEVAAHDPAIQATTRPFLVSQVTAFGEVLTPRVLLALASKDVLGASEALEQRDLDDRDPGFLLQRLWLYQRGQRQHLAAIEAMVGSSLEPPDTIQGARHLFFAAHLLRYRNRAFGAWDTAYQGGAARVRQLLDSGDEAAAFETCVVMFWFYRQLNQLDRVDLADLRRRAESYVTQHPFDGSQRQEVERLLAKME